MALDQRDQCALVSLADDGVAVPVADRAFLVHDGRAQLDAHAVIELATPLLAAAVAFPARPPGAACLRTCSRSNPVSREYRHEEKIRQRYQPREVRRDPPPPLLQSVRRRTKPTTVDLYEVFCAVLYIRAPRGKPPAKAEHRIRQKARFNHRRRPAGLK